MKITERQAEILNSLVETYIKSAEPVSSKFLEEKYKFGICPATIRIEMQKLTEEGFIFQPHTSAGRLPTDKGYRFFVDDLLERELLEENLDFEVEDWIEKEVTDSIKILQSITKNLASTSSNLALGYLPDLKIFWKEGWEEIIKEPEFEEKKIVDNFVGMIESFEEEIGNLEINSDTELPFMEAKGKKRTKSSSPIKVYIGRENPFPKAKEFSTIVTKCHFSEKENGILAILGPKRMDYNRNIGSLNSLIRLLETELPLPKEAKGKKRTKFSSPKV